VVKRRSGLTGLAFAIRFGGDRDGRDRFYWFAYPFEFPIPASFAADILHSGGTWKQGAFKAAAIFWPICCSICRSVLRLAPRLAVSTGPWSIANGRRTAPLVSSGRSAGARDLYDAGRGSSATLSDFYLNVASTTGRAMIGRLAGAESRGALSGGHPWSDRSALSRAHCRSLAGDRAVGE